uniref:Proteasome subunit beta n=1 Tax=Aureoumbra lagunensis TaxID=44058 RepID=A0A7S3K5B8_9STRA|mmetsp:Transcript_10999/g.15173  ORF Transcript_10999/g.15173 Transcript_10999/m.15173 type:complete len:288 (+) Transcript_10999:44-907(+)
MYGLVGPNQVKKGIVLDDDEGIEKRGFSFDLCKRNQMLSSKLGIIPKPMKTGTTICGVVYKDGVVLGADTRATGGTDVADKNCAKIHYLAENIYCCGAGTAADTERATAMIASQLELLRLSTGTKSRVVAAVTLLKRMLFRYQGHVSAALVLGGVDSTGPTLYQIYPHGSTGRLPYVTMGSGSLAAMSVFETGYRDNMDEADAIELVKDAIFGGIFNDLGSGSNVDIAIIRTAQAKAEIFRGFRKPNDTSILRSSYARPVNLKPPSGATTVLSTQVETFDTTDAPAL